MPDKLKAPKGSLRWLEEIMQRLLGPDGCPWDREQTLETLKPFVLEECYEVVDAIDSGDGAHHLEELGDLLFQIVFQAALANFELPAIINSIGDKLIRRHPHVFADTKVVDADEVLVNWEAIKAAERAEAAKDGKKGKRGTLDGVPKAMPALQRSSEMLRKAARVGFAWPDASAARAKVAEELLEVDEAAAAGTDNTREALHREFGDLLFAVTSWGRSHNVDAELALRDASDRFRLRFANLEQGVADDNKTIAELDNAALLDRWSKTKR